MDSSSSKKLTWEKSQKRLRIFVSGEHMKLMNRTRFITVSRTVRNNRSVHLLSASSGSELTREFLGQNDTRSSRDRSQGRCGSRKVAGGYKTRPDKMSGVRQCLWNFNTAVSVNVQIRYHK